MKSDNKPDGSGFLYATKATDESEIRTSGLFGVKHLNGLIRADDLSQPNTANRFHAIPIQKGRCSDSYL